MITVANRPYVKPEYADALEKVSRERAGRVDKMEGFISNQILRPVNEGDPYVVFTTWNSRLVFRNWVPDPIPMSIGNFHGRRAPSRLLCIAHVVYAPFDI